jgi:[acyl-carrier-protein] S-malonyltransferase
MFDRLAAADPHAGAVARARAARHVVGDPTDFSSNRTIQVSVTAVTLGWLGVVAGRGLRAAASAGLSLGEYAHLVDLEALEPDDAVALVATRGELYDQGPEGVMAAVFPVAWEELSPLVERIAGAHGGGAALAPAVFNSPTQTVVGGSRAAVAELVKAAEDELYAQGVIVEERVPMHTPRLEPVAARLEAALRAAPWTGRARVAYRPNVTAAPSAADPPTLVDRLTRHVHQPVLWRDTVDGLAEQHPDAVFLEVGPRTVLRDLMRRRWHAGRDVFALDDPDAPPEGARERVAATLDAVMVALAGGAQAGRAAVEAGALAGSAPGDRATAESARVEGRA